MRHSRHLESLCRADRVNVSGLCPPEFIAGGSEPCRGSEDATDSFPAVLPEGPHPIPSRTRKLRPRGPMVLQGKLCGRVGRRRELFLAPSQRLKSLARGFFLPGHRAERAGVRVVCKRLCPSSTAPGAGQQLGGPRDVAFSGPPRLHGTAGRDSTVRIPRYRPNRSLLT